MEKKRFDFSKLIGFNIYTIALILIVFLGGIGLTYAYYAFSYEEESVIAGNVINVDVDLEVELVVGTNEEMVPLNNDALSNALKGVGSVNGACVDNVGNLSCQVYKITLINNGSRVKHINGTIELYPKEGTGNVYNNLKWREITNLTTVKSDAVINGMSESVLVSDLTMESKTERTWYIAVWISEINSDQRETDKGLFGGTVTFIAGSGSGSSGTSGTKATDYIINKYNDGSTITTVNIGGDSSKPQVHLNATQGIMLDNNGEYRYYGANPNNYVLYNDELWRIISVGEVKSTESVLVEAEIRVKIIKADRLIDDNGLNAYSWDSTNSTLNSGEGFNEWSKSKIKEILNESYFNSTSGYCYNGKNISGTECNFTNTGLSEEAKNLTSDALYYLGGIETTEGLYANGSRIYERYWNVYNCSTSSCGGSRTTTWIGRVGIMYPSDYGYAVDLSVCTQDLATYGENSNCSENNWLLYGSTEFTISPRTSKSNVNFINSAGNVLGNRPYYTRVIRPVQYLKSSVKIIDGEGTDERPYILGT